jgi:hypothetical protein
MFGRENVMKLHLRAAPPHLQRPHDYGPCCSVAVYMIFGPIFLGERAAMVVTKQSRLPTHTRLRCCRFRARNIVALYLDTSPPPSGYVATEYLIYRRLDEDAS